MRLTAISNPTRPMYAPYIENGMGPDSAVKTTRQRNNISNAPAPVAIMVALPLRPDTDLARLGCWDWNISKSSPASKLMARSISAIRRRWSSLAFACWIVVRVIQRTAQGVMISTAIRESIGSEIVAATAAAMNPTEAGSLRSSAVSRNRSRALRLRYSSISISMRENGERVFVALLCSGSITFQYHQLFLA